ncbi:MAG: hypothetical protein AAGL17_16705 [Cyanobacteria bacterium J06576_12]
MPADALFVHIKMAENGPNASLQRTITTIPSWIESILATDIAEDEPEMNFSFIQKQ